MALKSPAEEIFHNVKKLRGRKLAARAFCRKERRVFAAERNIRHERKPFCARKAKLKRCYAVCTVTANIRVIKKLSDRQVQKHKKQPPKNKTQEQYRITEIISTALYAVNKQKATKRARLLYKKRPGEVVVTKKSPANRCDGLQGFYCLALLEIDDIAAP